MDKEDKIEIGDIVNVHFEQNESLIHMKITGLPYATGDSWKMKDQNGKVWYVQNYGTMELVGKLA